MPSISRRVCTIQGHGIYSGKRCPKCQTAIQKTYNDNRDKESEKFYHTARWRNLRKQQLTKHPLCINFEECGNVATIVDHIVEVKDGGAKFDLGNTQSMCRSCHSRKTAEEKKKRFRL